MRLRSRSRCCTPSALLMVGALLLLRTPTSGAQAAGRAHWSLSAGRTISSAADADRSFAFPVENFGLGASVEVEPWSSALALRATLGYDKFRGGSTFTLKATSLMLHAVLRPLPPLFGVRPYLLGGLGIATVAPSGAQVQEGTELRLIPIARATAMETDAGLGLEYRRLYMEYRHSPYRVVGDRMPSRTLVRLGFRL